MAGFITINGKLFPAPDQGLNFVVSTAVSGGKNSMGTMVGQKVGRDQYKIDSLQWKFLDAATWSSILKEFQNFFVTVRFPDMVNNDWITLKMYPGDRTATPKEVEPEYNADGSANPRAWLPKVYADCKVNIIDCGVSE